MSFLSCLPAKFVDFTYVVLPTTVEVSDSVVVSDRAVKAVSKPLLDSARSVDYTCKSAVKIEVEPVEAVDFVRKQFVKRVDVEGVPSGWVLPLTGKVFFDRVLTADRIVKTVEKEVEDVNLVTERLSKAVYVTFVDWFVGEYLAPKAVTIPRKDVGVTSDYIRKSIGKKAVETVGVSEVVIKGVVKRFVESAHVAELVSKLTTKVFEDVSKTVDIVAKVGFKLAGYNVRRVYFLPAEFKALWDIIESGDHNTKVEVCKALVEAFKRVRDKLGE